MREKATDTQPDSCAVASVLLICRVHGDCSCFGLGTVTAVVPYRSSGFAQLVLLGGLAHLGSSVTVSLQNKSKMVICPSVNTSGRPGNGLSGCSWFESLRILVAPQNPGKVTRDGPAACSRGGEPSSRRGSGETQQPQSSARTA